ncbi:MAG: hypothetical protein M5U34_29285 [Chloroflexi bacterium]|nr:hypothetical protein [Chloroflexota bacterium]
MTVQEAIQTLQNASPEDRIQIIELLLQSLKDDLSAKDKPQQPFKVRTFNLGSDVQADREQMYLERGL